MGSAGASVSVFPALNSWTDIRAGDRGAPHIGSECSPTPSMGLKALCYHLPDAVVVGIGKVLLGYLSLSFDCFWRDGPLGLLASCNFLSPLSCIAEDFFSFPAWSMLGRRFWVGIPMLENVEILGVMGIGNEDF